MVMVVVVASGCEGSCLSGLVLVLGFVLRLVGGFELAQGQAMEGLTGGVHQGKFRRSSGSARAKEGRGWPVGNHLR